MFKSYKKLWMGLVAVYNLNSSGPPGHGNRFGEWGTDELQGNVGYVPAGLAKMADIWHYAPLPDSVPGLTSGLPQPWICNFCCGGVFLVAGISMILSRVVDNTEEE